MVTLYFKLYFYFLIERSLLSCKNNHKPLLSMFRIQYKRHYWILVPRFLTRILCLRHLWSERYELGLPVVKLWSRSSGKELNTSCLSFLLLFLLVFQVHRWRPKVKIALKTNVGWSRGRLVTWKLLSKPSRTNLFFSVLICFGFIVIRHVHV